MDCEVCEFKKEVRKLDDCNIGAVAAVCAKCGNVMSDESISKELFEKDFDKIVATVLDIYSEIPIPAVIADLTELPIDFIKEVIRIAYDQ